jgi:U2-associated protein SR140
MVQEALRRAVLRLLRVWRDRFIFNDDYINGLQASSQAVHAHQH